MVVKASVTRNVFFCTELCQIETEQNVNGVFRLLLPQFPIKSHPLVPKATVILCRTTAYDSLVMIHEKSTDFTKWTKRFSADGSRSIADGILVRERQGWGKASCRGRAGNKVRVSFSLL